MNNPQHSASLRTLARKGARGPAVCALLFSCLFQILVSAQTVSKVRPPDNGDGTYKNPIIHADYSEPDAVRVGEDFYMTASSFNAAPGLPILHSKDLVNWRIVNHLFTGQEPKDVFSKPRHGGGSFHPFYSC